MLGLLGVLSMVALSAAGASADSIVVVAYDRSGIAVAADSRVMLPGADTPSDTACKILPLGERIFFVAAGHSLPAPQESETAGGELGWLYSEAGLAFKQATPRESSGISQSLVEAVAQRWKQAIQEVLEGMFAAQPESFVQMPRDGVLLRAVFGGLEESGDVSLVAVSVRPKKAPAFEVLMEHLTPGAKADQVALGKTQVVKEFAEQRTERARVEATQQEAEMAALDSVARLARRAARLVDLAIAHQSPQEASVGGAIDILTLSANSSSLQWLQRKPSCESVPRR